MLKGYIEAMTSALSSLSWTLGFFRWFFGKMEYGNIKNMNVNTAASRPLSTCIYILER